jgi:hypothetical protein
MEEMKMTLTRDKSTEKSTPGMLAIDGQFECYTLEDVVRASKIRGETAIPAGEYEVALTMSPRFKRILPLLVSVPGFDGIRIHPGNTDKDTEGCILVGESKSRDFIGSSRVAFMRLFNKLADAKEAGERITIEIKGA